MKKWIVAVFLLVASVASAQPQPEPRAQQRAERAERAEHRREQIKKRIRALRAYTLTEELSLDEQTAGKLFPLLAKYDEELDRLLVSRADLQRRLVAAGDLADARAVDKLIDEAVANQRALWDAEEKRLAQLRKILTPAQTARVLVVLPAMERRIQNQLKKVIRKQPGEPRGRGEVDPGGELLTNPFERAPLRERAPRRRMKQRAEGVPCDPFGTLHGCKMGELEQPD